MNLPEPAVFSEALTLEERTETIEGQLYMLIEQLRYTLSHLDLTNMNGTELDRYVSGVISPVTARIEGVDGEVAVLSASAEALGARLTDDEGNINDLSLTVDGFSARIQSAEGNALSAVAAADALALTVTDLDGDVAALQLSVGGLSSRVTSAEGDASEALQTANSFSARIASAEGDASEALMKAGSISLSVASASGGARLRLSRGAGDYDDVSLSLSVENNAGGYSTLSLKSGNVTIATSGNITLGGSVVFTGDLTDGTTTISGSNIKTGTIDASRVSVTKIDASNITTGTLSADRIDAASLKVGKVYTSDNRVAISAGAHTGDLRIGGDGTWDYGTVYITAGSNIRIGPYATVTSSGLLVDISISPSAPALTRYGRWAPAP